MSVFDKLEEKGLIHGREKPYVHQEYPKDLHFENPENKKKYCVTVTNWSEEVDANDQAMGKGHGQVVVKDPRQQELEEAKKETLRLQKEHEKTMKELAELKAQRDVGVKKDSKTKSSEE